eukprot:2327897-Rhodomonas_salina.2
MVKEGAAAVVMAALQQHVAVPGQHAFAFGFPLGPCSVLPTEPLKLPGWVICACDRASSASGSSQEMHARGADTGARDRAG